jgi:RsiW-degrading membrane proteinase PrsW (M82 family)
MAGHFIASALVCVLPVLLFLVALLFLDSYKIVRVRGLLAVILAGVVMAMVAYAVNAEVKCAASLDFETFTRYVSPVIEELLKAAVVVALIRMRRIGFLVDAAIFGFATGAGFAMIENLFYLDLVPDASFGTWVVRGFGTALMHGGATALFAVASLTLLEKRGGRWSMLSLAPGFALAVVLHSAYNHLFLSPKAATLAVVIVLPVVFYLVFRRSERVLGKWLGQGFDADARMLELLDSGRFTDSPTGRYLQTMKRKFSGPVVADALCYLRLHTELALRAKGILMMRENGFDAPVDEETRAKLSEMRFLERSIGKTGLRALRPVLHTTAKDEWQLGLLSE